jgi:hypothetical protein
MLHFFSGTLFWTCREAEHLVRSQAFGFNTAAAGCGIKFVERHFLLFRLSGSSSFFQAGEALRNGCCSGCALLFFGLLGIGCPCTDFPPLF